MSQPVRPDTKDPVIWVLPFNPFHRFGGFIYIPVGDYVEFKNRLDENVYLECLPKPKGATPEMDCSEMCCIENGYPNIYCDAFKCQSKYRLDNLDVRFLETKPTNIKGFNKIKRVYL